MADKKYYLVFDKSGKLVGKLSYAGVSESTEAHIMKGLESQGNRVEKATQAAYDLRRVYDEPK